MCSKKAVRLTNVSNYCVTTADFFKELFGVFVILISDICLTIVASYYLLCSRVSFILIKRPIATLLGVLKTIIYVVNSFVDKKSKFVTSGTQLWNKLDLLLIKEHLFTYLI